MMDATKVAMPTSGVLHGREATRFLATTYAWMFAGLALTTVVAWFVASTPAVYMRIASSPVIYWGLLIVELGLVIAISAAINRLSAGAATFLFLLYSAVNGATCAFILLVYSGESIFAAFMSACILFATLSFYGYATRRDLTSWGSLLSVGLIALIICGIVNMFIGSSGFDFLLGIVGIVIFLGLTAYDTQKILTLGAGADGMSAELARKSAILGALALYLDFINLFLYLLRIFGRRK